MKKFNKNVRKNCKKIFGLILATLILFSSFPYQVFALGPWDFFDEVEEASDALDELEVPDLNSQLEDFIIESEKYFGKTSEQLENISKSLNSVSTLMTTFQYISYTTSAVNNIMNILKMIGVMEDSNDAKLDSLLDAVKSIKESVEEINKKVTSIQKDLKNNFADESYHFDEIKAQNLQDAWANFMKNEYTEMMNIVSSYEVLVNQNAINWSETWKEETKTDLRALYNKKGLLMYSGSNYNGYNKELPVVPEMSDDTANKKLDTAIEYNIVLPSKYLKISPNIIINADNYEEVINKAITDGVNNAVNDGVIKIDAVSLPFWQIKDTTKKEDIINKISEDLINSMFYEITSIIANSNIGNGTTFAGNALSSYQAFCRTVNGDNNIGSAIENILDYLTLTFTFEGEAKEYAGAYYSLVGMATTQFGMLTSTLVAATPSIKSTTKTDLVDLMYNTIKKNNDTYKNFFHGSDNYCYPLKGTLNYVDISAQTLSMSNNRCENYSGNGVRCDHVEQNDSFSDWVIVDANAKINTDNLDVYKFESKRNETILKNSIVDGQNLAYLYRYIKSSNTNQSIMDYLKKNAVINDDAKHSTTLIASNFAIKDQPIDKTLLQSAPFGSDFKYYDRYTDNTIIPGYEKDKFVTAKSDNDYIKTLIHTKIVGDTFSISGNTSNGLATSDVESRSSYGVTLGTRVFQYDSSAFASPRYILHDEAVVTLDISESASDNSKFYLRIPYRSMYTAKVEKKYGALVLNYDINTDTNKYQLSINNKTEFIEFIKKIANGNTYEGKNIILKNDIDLNNENLEKYWPSSLSSSVFKGNFNGNDKTISNLTISSSGNHVALFRTTGENVIIENLKLKNVNITGTDNKNGYAALVGYADGRLIVNNVEIVSGNIKGYKYVAGIVGEARENTKVNILNSTNNAHITSTNADAGGIIGNTGNYYIYKCLNTGNITATRGAAGGMSGYSGSDSKKDSSFVRESKNTGNIVGYDCAGGISGHIASDDRFSRFFDNENTGSVTVTYKGSAGGIVGYTEGGGAYINNKNIGIIETVDRYAGGILGENEDDPILIKGNTNEGAVTAKSKSGGIAGYLGDKDYDLITIIQNNYNKGSVVSTSKDTGDAGGIVGSIYTDNAHHIVSNNTNEGSVIAERQAGGIIGYMAGGGGFDSNTNKANITSNTQNAGGIVGKIQDDKCTFRNSNVYKPRVIIGDNLSVTSEKTDYQIIVKSGNMHAGKIVGWDDYKDATINNDSLVATIFGEGNILTIIILLIILVLGCFGVYFYSKKNEIKTLKTKTSKKKKNNKK